MNVTIFIVFLVIEIGCAVVMRSIARKRGGNETIWFIVGLILGPLAFIFVPIIKNKKR